MLVLTFSGILALCMVIGLLLSKPKASTKEGQRTLHIMARPSRKEEAPDGLIQAVKEQRGLAATIEAFATRFKFAQKLQKLILYSGTETTVGSVLSISLLGAVLAGVIAHFVLGALPVDLLAVGAGGAARSSMLKFQGSRRLKKFNDALADAIELIARALRAGHSIGSAVEIVAEQSPAPLGPEFAIVFQQQKFGIPFRDALLELGERVPSRDLHFLITAILVQKETGGDLTEVLDRTTRVIRERVRIEGEIKTYTAQGRLTGWILASLPVAMLVLINIVTPGYSHILFYDPTGQKLLYAGGTLIVIGGLIIRKIVDIKV
jgi:tight adherence protein B